MNNSNSFTISVKADFEELRNTFKNLSKAEIDLACARAINRTLMVGRTEARNAVKSVYTVAQRYLPKNVDIKRATPNRLWGAVVASATPLPADAFNLSFRSGTQNLTISKRGKSSTKSPKGLKARQGGGVVFEAIRGKREVYAHAFLLPNNKPRVFARGEYKKGNGAWGFKQRLGPGSRKPNAQGNDSVKPLIAVSIHGAAINPIVQQKIENRLVPYYRERFVHEINYIISKR